MKIKFFISFLILAFMLSCGKKQALPTAPEQGMFTSLDTGYLKLSPEWKSFNNLSFSNPTHLMLAEDGMIFVSDSGNNRIAVFNRAGKEQNYYPISGSGTLPHPVSCWLDSRLYLFIVNGSDSVFAWDNAAFLTGFADDSLIEPYLFYADNLSKFNSVCVLKNGDVLLSDYENDRIIRVQTIPGDTLQMIGPYAIQKIFPAATFTEVYSGTGRGSVLHPEVLYATPDNNILIGQAHNTEDRNFFKLQIWDENCKPVGGGSDLGNLLEVDRFISVCGVCQDERGWIYAAEQGWDGTTKRNRISIFNSAGKFLFRAGVNSEIQEISTDSTTTYQKIYLENILQNCGGIAVRDDILYVTDKGNNRILRFQLSISNPDIY